MKERANETDRSERKSAGLRKAGSSYRRAYPSRLEHFDRFCKMAGVDESIQEMHLQGKVEAGAEFRWKSGSMKIGSRIEHIAQPFTIVWSGRTMGIRAIHSWTFTAEKNGTKARTEESFEGFLARLFAGPMRKILANALQQGLDALKKEAEKRHQATEA